MAKKTKSVYVKVVFDGKESPRLKVAERIPTHRADLAISYLTAAFNELARAPNKGTVIPNMLGTQVSATLPRFFIEVVSVEE